MMSLHLDHCLCASRTNHFVDAFAWRGKIGLSCLTFSFYGFSHNKHNIFGAAALLYTRETDERRPGRTAAWAGPEREIIIT
jgi:hypothetical protein